MNKVTAALAITLLSATSSLAQTSQWVYFSGPSWSVQTFIDPSSKKTYGFGEEGITTLSNYAEKDQSATTFGLSEVETLIFDCGHSRMKFYASTWYSLQNAKGRVTKKFPIDNKWSPIPRNYILLFAKVCVGG